jgi:hypothetical protein
MCETGATGKLENKEINSGPRMTPMPVGQQMSLVDTELLWI